MAKMSMVDQRLLQMQLGSIVTVRALLDKAFTVESIRSRKWLLLTTRRLFWWLIFFFFLLISPQGEKNNGFDVLYHNMKHGQISSKELTDFIRERWEDSVVVIVVESPDGWSVRLGQTLRFSHQGWTWSLPQSDRPALLFLLCCVWGNAQSLCSKNSCMPDGCSHQPTRQFA